MVVAASDIAATAHCKEVGKKWVFQLQKNLSYPDLWEHWGDTNDALMALQLISSQSPRVSTNDERNQHPVWPGDLIQTELSRSAFRVMFHKSTLLSEQHTHCQQSKSSCTSCSSQSHHLEQRFLPEELWCINPLCLCLSFGFDQFFIWSHQSFLSSPHRAVSTL